MSLVEPVAAPHIVRMSADIPAASTYRWDPRAYDQQAGFVSAAGQPLLDWLAPKARERILDLGCGTGTLTAGVASHGADVLGVDASAEMIAAAQRAHPGVAFEVGRGEALAFEEDFDAVFSNAALHWMRPPERVAAGTFRALRRGGRLVAELGAFGNTRALLAAVDGALLELAGKDSLASPEGRPPLPRRFEHPWYFPRLGAYAALLEGVGFEVRASSVFDRPTPVPDRSDCSGIATWMGLFAADLMTAVGKYREAAFLEAVERRCRTTLFRDGAWWIDYVRLRVMATKPP